MNNMDTIQNFIDKAVELRDEWNYAVSEIESQISCLSDIAGRSEQLTPTFDLMELQAAIEAMNEINAYAGSVSDLESACPSDV